MTDYSAKNISTCTVHKTRFARDEGCDQCYDEALISADEDRKIFGTGFVRLNSDGTAERIDQLEIHKSQEETNQ